MTYTASNGVKKLLITTGIFFPDIGGPATYASQVVKGLGSMYDVQVLTYSPLLRKIPQPFRQVIFIVKTWWAGRKADVIYSLSPLGTGVATALIGKPFIVRVAGDRAWEDAVNAGKTHLLLDDFQKLKRRGFKHKLQAWVCKKARAVVVPSEYLAGIVRGWGIAPEKIHVIYNAVDLAVEPLSSEEARRQIGIPGKLLVTIGRLVPWKGFRLLIKIMPRLLEVNPFFRLIIVGDGPDRVHLSAMIKNMNLQQKVFLVGAKTPEEIVRYFHAAELFILNSGYEGFSHLILEAMSRGVPVITTSVGGNREIIKQGENGFMVKYNDEFNLIEAVKTLWSNSKLRESFSKEGKETASRYTVEKMVTKTLDVINLK